MRRAPTALLGAVLCAGLLASCGRDAADDGGLGETGRTALEAWAGFHVPGDDRIPHGLATNPGTPWGDFTGSPACRGCHEQAYAAWRQSFHSRTLYDAVERTVFGDFGGRAWFDDPRFPFRVRPWREEEAATGRVRFFMEVRRRPGFAGTADTYGAGVPADPEGTWEVLHAFGNRRHQPYVARGPDGKHWVLPVFWNDAEREWRYDGFRPYAESCAACHVTGLKTSLEPWTPGLPALPQSRPRRFNLPPAQEGWAEGAVGCEVCHGPGRAHVEAVERTGTERYRALRRAGEKGPTIWSGRGTAEDQVRQCDQCHDFFTEAPFSWAPGPHGFDRPPDKDPIRPVPGNDSQFYADGSRKSPCSIGQDFRTSKMHANEVRCTDCHDPHGTPHWADLVLPTAENALCLKCHDRQFPDPDAETRHSRHARGSPGNLCVECHMPRHLVFTNGVEMMSERIPRHDFSVPTGEQRPGGPPPSCNVCHTDRDASWTRAVLAAWREGREPPR